MTLEEKVELLTDIVVHGDRISKLALELDWEPAKIRKIYSIMDRFFYDEKQEYKYTDVDSAFWNIGISYQEIKPIFIIFFENDQYISVIKRYLKTNCESYGNVSGEYVSMYRELFIK